MKVFRCDETHITYAMDAVRIVKYEEDHDHMDMVTEESMRAFLADPDHYLIVAAIEQNVVGYIVAYELKRVDRDAAMMLLYEIGVLKANRKRGIGSVLIDCIKDICRERNIIKMWVIADRANIPAVKLYTETGGEEDADGEEVSFTYYPPFDK